MRILFFIGQLKTGGAERQLVNLCKGLSTRDHRIFLTVIFPGGQLSKIVEGIKNIELISLWKFRSNCFIVRFVQILFSPVLLGNRIKNSNPDAIYSLLLLTNLIAWLATRGKNADKLIWGLRSSSIRLIWKQAFPEKICAYISTTVPLIIINSYAGLYYYQKRGYRPERFRVISNGIDVEYFQFQPDKRKLFRQELGLSEKHILVGIVARLIPVKNHALFFEAAARVVEQRDDVCFLVVGEGDPAYSQELLEKVESLGIDELVFWLGYREDMVAIYNALDLLVSSSTGEGFPNVIGEAMACGAPCVVTDVGDSARIVGNPNCVVKPNDSTLLAGAICEVLQQDDRFYESKQLRSRIIENYSLQILIESTEQVLGKQLLPQ
jgi:glycosyltransferase involved in cell wall biosynthesis